MKQFIYLMSVMVLTVSSPVFVGAEDALPQFALTSQDRILVIAPHPDDETIGAGGVIQEAIRLNIPVHVMYLTNGDSNPLAFSLYKKRPIFGKNQALEMGRLRQKEAIEATGRLGLREDQLIFLSYPDYGTLRIFKKFWQVKKSYRSTLTRALSVPYSLSLTPGASHQAQNVLSDFKKVLLDVRPTKVFVTHPVDQNTDHQAAYLFLRVALWDVQEQLSDSALYTYLVHAVDWPRNHDEKIQLQSGQWTEFKLSSQQVKQKNEAVDRYRTQIPYKPKFLYSFVSVNELFALIPDVTLKVQSLDAQAWDVLNQEQQSKRLSNLIDTGRQIVLKAVVYGLDTDRLIVKIKLNQWSRSGFNINLYLFGYKNDMPFERMPKYRVQLTNDHEAVVFDGQKRVRVKNVKVSRSGNDLYVAFPRSLMHDPDRIISLVSVRVSNWPVENSMWSVIKVE